MDNKDHLPADGELVPIIKYIPDAVIDLKYATTDNFTGQVIYSSNEALLCYGTIKKLMKVQEILHGKGMRMLIWDAYRPYEAQKRLWEVCPDPVFVADPRNGLTSHSFGNTVDIGLVSEDGSLIEMPSEFDDFSERANRDYSNIPPEAASNAMLLEHIMTECGFEGYYNEWWHYSDKERYELK